MSTPPEHAHLDRIRERFTRTADDFAQFALSERAVEGELLARMAVAGFGAPVRLALDLACGPGTFTRGIAAHARFVLGLDYTAAMLAKARDAAATACLVNIHLVRGDGNRLPIADAALDVATCGYSLHHFSDPVRAIREMARVVRREGRVGAADLIVPAGCDAEAANRVERARDPSHARTLTADELRRLFEEAGLGVREDRIEERPRAFDDWMRNVGQAPGSPLHRSVRELMAADIGRDNTGFHPRWIAEEGGAIEFVQTTFFIVGEKR